MSWSPVTESNRRPSPYHGDALPTELTGRVFTGLTCGFAIRAERSGRAQRWYGVSFVHGKDGPNGPTQVSLPYSCRRRAYIWRRPRHRILRFRTRALIGCQLLACTDKTDDAGRLSVHPARFRLAAAAPTCGPRPASDRSFTWPGTSYSR